MQQKYRESLTRPSSFQFGRELQNQKKIWSKLTAAENPSFSCRGRATVSESSFCSFSVVFGCFRVVFRVRVEPVLSLPRQRISFFLPRGTDPTPRPDFNFGRFVAQNRLFSPVSVSVSDTTRLLPSFDSKLCRAITFAYELRFRRTSTHFKATEKFFPAIPTSSVYTQFFLSKLPKEFGKAEIFGL